MWQWVMIKLLLELICIYMWLLALIHNCGCHCEWIEDAGVIDQALDTAFGFLYLQTVYISYTSYLEDTINGEYSSQFGGLLYSVYGWYIYCV